MGEVLTWDNCRFHSGGGAPSLLLTWRAQRAPWNIIPPSGRSLATGITLTQFRIFGGEMTGDNTALLVMDMGGAGKAGGGDFASYGLYFATSGNHIAAVEIRGKWNNVIFDGSRDEETDFPANADRGFLRLVSTSDDGMAQLKNFRIHAYSDGDEVGPIIRGTGDVASGTIVSGAGGGIVLNGTISGVELRSTAHNGAVPHTRYGTPLAVTGNCTDVTLHSALFNGDSSFPAPEPVVRCGGEMAVSLSGAGAGVFVVRQALNATTAKAVSSATELVVVGSTQLPALRWQITRAGLYEASFAGDRMSIHVGADPITDKLFVVIINYLDMQALSGNAAAGKLLLNGTVLTAQFSGAPGRFEVRKFA